MKQMIKNEKGVTMIAIVITIIILLIIVATVSFSSKNGIDMKKMNNMYTDIILLEDKVAFYYLEHGTIPAKGAALLPDEIPDEIKTYNPNDNENYYKLDLDLLENVDLNYAIDASNVRDIYIINEKSHAIYYLKGVTISEYDNLTMNRKQDVTYYTIPRKYDAVDLVELESEIEGVDAVYTDINVFAFSSSDPSVIIGFNAEKYSAGSNFDSDLVIPFERTYVDENGLIQTVRITKIEENAFNADKNIKIKRNVYIPNKITVGKGAFKGQSAITGATLYVSYLGEGAFENCSAMKNLTIKGLKTIPKNAFKGALKASNVGITIGEPVEVIEENAFSGISYVTKIVFPKTLKRVNAYAFANPTSNTGIENIDFSLCDGLMEIGDSAFFNHKNINAITVSPLARIKIGQKAFNNESSSIIPRTCNFYLNDYSTYYTNSFPSGFTIHSGTNLDSSNE